MTLKNGFISRLNTLNFGASLMLFSREFHLDSRTLKRDQKFLNICPTSMRSVKVRVSG